jgi:PAS domain S-box-containing protein
MLPWEIVLDELSEGIITIDSEGAIERVNGAALGLLGYATAEPLLGGCANLLVDPRWEGDLSQMHLPPGAVEHVNIILKQGDGSALPQKITLCGIDRGRLGIVLRPQTDEMEKDRYKILFEEIKAVMLLIDPDTGAIIDANPAASQYYGWSKEALIRMRIDQINALTREEVVQEMARAKRQEKEYFLFRHRLADGQVRDVEVYSNRIRVGGRELLYSIVHDIQEKRALERELSNERSLFRELIEAIPDMVFLKDLEGRYIGSNHAFARITGKSRDEVIGKMDPELFPEERAEFFHGQDLKVLASEDRIRYEQWIEVSGKRITLDVIKSPYRDADGNIVGIIGVAREITHKKAMETALIEAKQEAERANRLKTQFLANMSHEIRTPMNGVMGFLQLLGGTELDEEQREYLTIIRHASDTLLKLINDILDLSKIESDNVELEILPYDLDSVLETTLLTFSASARKKGIRVTLEKDPEVPATIAGDPTRLRQVLYNLVGNAIKFTEEGSVRIQVTASESSLVFRVIDTGIGMEEDVVERIFSPFVQADASIARAHGGTGLGLAITRRLVEAMGGRIQVETTLETGTCFTVTLPYRSVEAEEVWEDSTFLQDRRVFFCGDEFLYRYLKSICSQGRGTLRRFDTVDALAIALVKGKGEPDLLVLQADAPKREALEGFLKQEGHGQIPRLIYREEVDGNGPAEKSPDECSDRARMVAQMRRLIMGRTLSGAVEEPLPGAVEKPQEERVILLVEDNPTNRLLLRKKLEKVGYRCDLAIDGREALERAKERDYPLILMDCEMPYMDGFEATRRIRALPGHQPVIIALTAHAMEEDRRRCIESGMDEYLSKPVDLERLVELLARIG